MFSPKRSTLWTWLEDVEDAEWLRGPIFSGKVVFFQFVCWMLRLCYLCLVFVFLLFLCLHCFDAGKRNEAASLARQGFEAILSLAINLQHPSVWQISITTFSIYNLMNMLALHNFTKFGFNFICLCGLFLFRSLMFSFLLDFFISLCFLRLQMFSCLYITFGNGFRKV